MAEDRLKMDADPIEKELQAVYDKGVMEGRNSSPEEAEDRMRDLDLQIRMLRVEMNGLKAGMRSSQ